MLLQLGNLGPFNFKTVFPVESLIENVGLRKKQFCETEPSNISSEYTCNFYKQIKKFKLLILKLDIYIYTIKKIYTYI